MLILLSQVLQRVTSIFANLKFLRNAFIPQSNSLEEKKRSNNRQGPYYSLNTESQSRPQGVLSPPQKSQISRVAKKRTKRCLTSLIVRELQIKTTMRFSLTPVIMIIQKKNQKIYKKWWRRCGEKGTLLYCWWECKFVQLLWRTTWRFLKKLEQNNATCSNMDGSRDCHIQWNKSDTERQIPYDITYSRILKKKKKKGPNTYSQNRSRVTDAETNLWSIGNMQGKG